MSNEQTKKEKAKVIVGQFIEFIKDNKLSCGMFFGGGMLIAAKLYPMAVVLTIVGAANIAMDRVVDRGIAKATEQCWNMFTPEQQMKLYAMVSDMDESEMEETVV